MNARLAAIVRKRARNRCEYCHLPESATSMLFELDHIIAEQHGGVTTVDNLAFSCFYCNHHKGPNLAGIDSKTGKRAWLFHPRQQLWTAHFNWNGALLQGITPCGRATIAVLAINYPIRVEQRKELMAIKMFRKP